MASGSQDVNHLDEKYDGNIPDILDNAYVIVNFENGVRGLLDLCMFAEASKNEQEISIVGDKGKIEAMISESVVRVGKRKDGYGSYQEVPIEIDQNIVKGYHHGASYTEHMQFFMCWAAYVKSSCCNTFLISFELVGYRHTVNSVDHFRFGRSL